MTVLENKRFNYVKPYSSTYSLADILRLSESYHLRTERDGRFKRAIKLNDGAEIDQAFLVDKGHPNGAEIHFVTKNGCIFICNQQSMKLITVFIAQRSQIFRLYEACGLPVEESILGKYDSFHVHNNKIA